MARARSLFALLVALLSLSGAAPAEPPRVAAAAPAPPRVEAPRPAPVPAGPVAVSPLPEGFMPGSTYGDRINPRTGGAAFHAGADFLAPRGTPVLAVRAGVVERVTTNTLGRTRFAGYGRSVVVYHPDVTQWSYYAHLDRADVHEGQLVAAGDPLGVVGKSSNDRFPDMPPHLHFEVRHAARGRPSPFPGTYREHNHDPIAWLESMGVVFVSAPAEPDAADPNAADPNAAEPDAAEPEPVELVAELE